MKHFLLNSIVVLLIFSMSGCGIFGKSAKLTERERLDMSKEFSKDSVSQLVDRSVILVREKADTVITIPEQLIREAHFFTLDSLINGMTAVKSDLVDVHLLLNPFTKKLSAEAVVKPQRVPVKVEKETLRYQDIKAQSAHTVQSKAVLKEGKTRSLTEQEPVQFGYWLAAVLVVAGSVFFVLRMGKV